jgi:TatD DNase family protein
MIDTHCHLTFDTYDARREAVIRAAREAGVSPMITVSTTSDNAMQSLHLATTYDDIYCTAGIHPLYSDQFIDWRVIKQVITHERCVAWGELGLDNHYKEPAAHIQRNVLEEHLAVIESVHESGLVKPVVVHCRESFDDLLPVFRSSTLDPAKFVFHCFTGSVDDAKHVLDFGAWISFTGVVTFKNAPEVAAAAAIVPADRIMVETDAPFLTPAPHRKVWPNEPKYVVHTARHIADLRGEPYEEFERTLDANARRFFNLP